MDYKTGAPPSGRQVQEGYALQLGLIGMIAGAGGFDGVAGEDAAPPDDEEPEEDSLEDPPLDELLDDELSPDVEELLGDAGDVLEDVPRLSLR